MQLAGILRMWYIEKVTQAKSIVSSLGSFARVLSVDWRGYSWGPPRGRVANLERSLMSVLASSQDSLPDIRNIQSDNLRVVE